MDFFQAQDEARRRSRWLILAFAAAVAVETLAVYAVVHLAFGPGPGQPVDSRLFVLVAAVTVGAVLLATSWRANRLREGGPAVAAILGGRRVRPDTQRQDERRLFNVVEEMAIAAGIPVPAVFVLDRESGINAFAAGFTPADAAIAVTTGALLRLDRHELRAMAAHEVAHILNGDMRVHTRLLGLLAGLLLPGVLGRAMLAGRMGAASRAAKPGWVAAGVVLVALGELGLILGRVIQAAVSRQRELLADAAAVQFTRDPGAMAAVLVKIGGLAFGSRVTHPHAPELAHLFLGQGVAPPLLLPLDTHPPLVERIRRIDPAFDGTFPLTLTPRRVAPAGDAPMGTRPDEPGSRARELERLGVAAILASIGEPGANHLDHAARFLAGLPADLRDALHDPAGARAALVAMLLAEDAETEAAQLAVAEAYDPAVAREAGRLLPAVRAQGAGAAVPLLELALPALGLLSPEEGARFRRAILDVIRARGRARVLDLAVMRVLARRVGGGAGSGAGSRAGKAPGHGGHGGIPSFRPLRHDLAVLLSAVSRAADQAPAVVGVRFDAGARLLPRDLELELLPVEETRLADVDAALSRLEAASATLRRRILEAAMAAITADGGLAAEEVEMIRAAAEALDLPLPPVLLTGALPVGAG
jgi:Zn-dependent protease with chaperone function